MGRRVASIYWRSVLTAKLTRYIVYSALGLVALAVGFVICFALYLQSPPGRNALRDWLNKTASAEMQGVLSIGAIDKLELDGVVASNVKLLDAQRQTVINADQVVLVPDLKLMLKGILHIKSAKLTGGSVHLIETPSGAITLLQAFEPKQPSLQPSEATLNAVVDGIELSRVTVYGDVGGVKNWRVEDVSARGRLEMRERLEIRIEKAQARVTRPYPFEIKLRQLNGVVSGDPYRGVNLQAEVARNGDKFKTDLEYKQVKTGRAPEPQKLTVNIQASPVSPETLRGLGFDWAGSLRAPLNGKISLQGELADLQLNGALNNEAGAFSLQGYVSSHRGVGVTLQTNSLALGKAVNDAPPVTVAGSASIEAAPGVNPNVSLQLEPLLFGVIALPAFQMRGAIKPVPSAHR